MSVEPTAEACTAYNLYNRELRVRFRNNGDHIAVMLFDVLTDRFMRVNVSPDDFARIVAAVSPQNVHGYLTLHRRLILVLASALSLIAGLLIGRWL